MKRMKFSSPTLQTSFPFDLTLLIQSLGPFLAGSNFPPFPPAKKSTKRIKNDPCEERRHDEARAAQGVGAAEDPFFSHFSSPSSWGLRAMVTAAAGGGGGGRGGGGGGGKQMMAQPSHK